ncbi:cyclic-AMP phosphodiesterase [Exidia glandulosa HHB12029]|uniref:Cyclic-AMP phosphodiesterase n=1 Tax=Exidia glandulosa HHB12029 TaxID=1314781 RepID=A0A165IY72_EXIGL|nr:cyclic-AMP phosphodiesterase [Exidia glandulosa HHB12029]
MGAAFEIVVVGCGGGPDETNLSSYLLKAADAFWQDGIVSLEAGSGVGTLQRLLSSNPRLFQGEDTEDAAQGPAITAAQVYSYISDYLITHTHNDHICSLVLSGGSHSGVRKRIRALPCVVDNLQETVFNDKLWPSLASFNEVSDDAHKYLYKPLQHNGEHVEIGHGLSARAMPISHGCTSAGKLYESTAFFVRNDVAEKEFLFFGDVEPDSVSQKPQTRAVWRTAARLIPDELDTIFLECSYRASRPMSALFGHLSPPHVAAELRTLAHEVVEAKQRRASDASFRSAASHNGTNGDSDGSSRPRKRPKVVAAAGDGELTGALRGVRVYIIHCKEQVSLDDDRPTPDAIAEEIRQHLLSGPDLGVEIVAVRQGMRLVF